MQYEIKSYLWSVNSDFEVLVWWKDSGVKKMSLLDYCAYVI